MKLRSTQKIVPFILGHPVYFDGAPLDHLGDRRAVGKKVLR